MAKKLRVLVACEFSGIVRDAFLARGHDAVSVDLEWTEVEGPHIMGDVRACLNLHWDLMLAFPPCRFLAASGSRWWSDPNRKLEQEKALQFVIDLLDAPIPHIALENPVGCISTRIRKPDQYIQPYEYGHQVRKKTGLWLKHLPKLEPTKVYDGEPKDFVLSIGPGPNRRKSRSRTFKGVARAMADQWGEYLTSGGLGITKSATIPIGG